MKTSDELIIVEETFDSTAESVWNALTEIEQMKKWYFENIPAFKPEPGFKTEFIVKSEERNFLHMWEVTEVKLHQLIKYVWQFEHYQGKSSTAFEIAKLNNQAALKLTVEVLEDFQEDIPEFKRESCIAGWNYFINNRLKEYLKNQK